MSELSAPILSILRFDSLDLKTAVETYAPSFDPSIFQENPRQFSRTTRRTAALALVRHLLITHHLIPASKVSLVTIQHRESGEPFLDMDMDMDLDLEDLDNQHSPALHISISHSGPWLACVLSPPDVRGCIDIEDRHKKRDYESIARRFFYPPEITCVQNQGSIGFYKIWTAKEALAKFHGQGLAHALSQNLNEPFLLGACLDYVQNDIQLKTNITSEYIYTVAQKTMAQ